MEGAVLLAAATVPVMVNYYAFSVFEPAKRGLVVTFAAVALGFALVALIEGGGRGWRTALRRPLPAAAGLLLVATGVSTAASVVPRLSLMGSLERSMGWVTLAAVLALFAAALCAAREPARRARIVAALVAGSLPVAVYALTQALGLVAVPGIVESEARVFGTLSNPIFLAAYLMLVMPLTVVRLAAAARAGRPGAFAGLALVLALQLAAVVLSGSRGPQLGLGVGLAVLALGASAVARRRGLGWAVIGLGLAAGAFLVVFNLPGSPLAGLRDAPVIGRFGRIADTSSGSEAARIRIWRSVDRLLAAEPARLATGHGPEALKYALIPHAETYVAGRGQASRLVDRAHNVLLDALVTTGLPGALALLLVYGAWLHTAATAGGLAPGAADRRRLALCLAGGTLAGAAAWLVAPVYGGALTALGMVAGLTLYLVLRLAGRSSDDGGAAALDDRAALGLALLAAGAAAVVEASFGIQTVVTEMTFWVLAGLVAALGAGDAPPADAAQGRPPARARETATTASAGQTVTLSWSPGGAALGAATGAALGVLTFAFVIFGTTPLPDTLPVLALLVAATLFAGLTAAADAGESRTAQLVTALFGFALYFVFRAVVLAVSLDASVLYAATVAWLALLALVAGVWLRGDVARDRPAWVGPAGFLYPVLAVPLAAVVLLVAVQPVRADIYFQSASANFDAALSGDDAALYGNAETLFARATALNDDEDNYYLLWGERFTQVGAAAQDVTQAAQAFQRAQELVAKAEERDPLMPYHVFNRGHLQLVFAQKLEPGSQQALAAAANAAVALQQVFDKVPYDPLVADELALARLMEGKHDEAIRLLTYSRDALDDRNPLTYRLLGQAYAAAGRTAEAKAALEQALALGGDMPAADRQSLLLSLGEMARASGDLDAAARHYEALMATGAGDWRMLFNLGLVYRDKRDYERAFAALSQVLQVAPQDAETRAQIQSALDDVIVRRGAGAPGGGSSLPGTGAP